MSNTHPYKKVHPQGSPTLSATDINAAYEDIMRMSESTPVPGSRGAEGVLGAHEELPVEMRDFLVRIVTRDAVGPPPVYGWKRVIETGTGTVTDMLPYVTGGATFFPAYELSGNANVPASPTTGAVVSLRPGASGQYFEFAYSSGPDVLNLTNVTVNWTNVTFNITNSVVNFINTVVNFYGPVVFPPNTQTLTDLTVNNYDFQNKPKVAFLTDPDGDRTITGLLPGTPGQLLFLINLSANKILLKHESPLSALAGRFNFGRREDIRLDPSDDILLEYVSARWLYVGDYKHRVKAEFGTKGLAVEYGDNFISDGSITWTVFDDYPAREAQIKGVVNWLAAPPPPTLPPPFHSHTEPLIANYICTEEWHDVDSGGALGYDLPAAGSYLITADICCQLLCHPADESIEIWVRLYDYTKGEVVPNSERRCRFLQEESPESIFTISTHPLTVGYTIYEPSWVVLQAKYVTGFYTAQDAEILGDGHTTLTVTGTYTPVP